MSNKKYSLDLSSASSTECDSCEERDDENYFNSIPKTNPLKFKTELCKKYSTIGYCNYGEKCKFAHGVHELVRLPTSEHFRKKKCSKFWANGVCPYGLRCQFGHNHIENPTTSYLAALAAIDSKPVENGSSRLMKLLNN